MRLYKGINLSEKNCNSNNEIEGQFQIFQDNSGKFRFRLIEPNGTIISISNKGFKNIEDCKGAIGAVNDLVPKRLRVVILGHEEALLDPQEQYWLDYFAGSFQRLQKNNKQIKKPSLPKNKITVDVAKKLMAQTPLTDISLELGQSVQISKNLLVKKRSDGTIVLEETT